VTPEQVAEITEKLPADVEKVGVFATDDPYEIEHYVASVGLTAAQIHGAFDAERVRALAAEFGGKLKIIQTVAYAVDATDAEDREDTDDRFEWTLEKVFEEPAVWAVLIDAAKAGASGGLGVALDWAHVAEITRRAMRARGVHGSATAGDFGGRLNAENVGEAIAAFAPWGVDVASGVESAPGKKDPERLRAL